MTSAVAWMISSYAEFENMCSSNTFKFPVSIKPCYASDIPAKKISNMATLKSEVPAMLNLSPTGEVVIENMPEMEEEVAVRILAKKRDLIEQEIQKAVKLANDNCIPFCLDVNGFDEYFGTDQWMSSSDMC